MDGFDFVLISLVLTEIAQDFHLSTVTAATLVSAAFVSRWFGGLAIGALSDRFGRRPAMVLSIALYAVGSVLCGFSWGYWSLFAFRMVVGLGHGGRVQRERHVRHRELAAAAAQHAPAACCCPATRSAACWPPRPTPGSCRTAAGGCCSGSASCPSIARRLPAPAAAGGRRVAERRATRARARSAPPPCCIGGRRKNWNAAGVPGGRGRRAAGPARPVAGRHLAADRARRRLLRRPDRAVRRPAVAGGGRADGHRLLRVPLLLAAPVAAADVPQDGRCTTTRARSPTRCCTRASATRPAACWSATSATGSAPGGRTSAC